MKHLYQILSLKKTYSLLLALFIVAILYGCSDDKDEPINSVISFLSLDKNITISNGGTHAILNVGGLGQEVSIALGGDFSNYKIDVVDNNNILHNVKIEDRVLKFDLWQNWVESRSANITITANNATDIVKAELVVNQAKITDAEAKEIELYEIEWYVNAESAVNFPTDGNISKDVWYKLDNGGTGYARLVNCADNRIPIDKGSQVQLTYAGVPVYETSYLGEWWNVPYVWNNDNPAVFIFNGVSNTLISSYGKGLLLPLELGICYGDDFDIVLSSDLGVPDAKTYRSAFVYAVQYNDPTIITAKSAKR